MKSAYKNVPVREDTFERLRAYKMGDATFDALLNELMDAVPIEKVAARAVREHKRRMKTFKGRDWRDVRSSLGDD